MATTIVQQAPAPAPPAANTDMMQMMMMNNMMQQQNEQAHARAMEREHAHEGGGGGGAPVVVNVQGGAPQMLIKPPPNCCMKCCCPPCAVWMHEVRMPLVDSTPLSPASPPPAIYPVGRLSLTACRLSLCRAWAATSSWPSSPGCAALAGASPCAAGCRTRTASSRAWRSPTWSAKLPCSPSRSAGKGEEACTSTVQDERREDK